MKRLLPAMLVVTGLFLAPVFAQEEKKTLVKHHEEVIYGHKFGMALTFDYLQPQDPNGLGVLYMMSGGWFSNRAPLLEPEARAALVAPFLRRGYTVFLVYHGSQPKFTIPEIVEDVRRAVRFIRHDAKRFGVDPDRLGVSGGSAGGHLSLMLGTTGAKGDPKARDPIDRESSAVAAVACFFPPTDFLNYGKPGEDAVGVGILKNFRPAFGPEAAFPDPDKLVPFRQAETLIRNRKELGKKISPVNFVSARTPPTLIIHGDADTLVPYQQAELFIEKCKEFKVPAELVRKEKAGHGWKGIDKDVGTFVDWFDKHLKAKGTDKADGS